MISRLGSGKSLTFFYSVMFVNKKINILLSFRRVTGREEGGERRGGGPGSGGGGDAKGGGWAGN